MKTFLLLFILLSGTLICAQPSAPRDFKIRTITAGITMADLHDTLSFKRAIEFLLKARSEYQRAGYEVQTLRISTQNLFEYKGTLSLMSTIPLLVRLDNIAIRHNMSVAIGSPVEENHMDLTAITWAAQLMSMTTSISFSIPISAAGRGIYPTSIDLSAQIISSIARNTKGGEGNFRFTATANCPQGIPFFPAATHRGTNSFALGFESPNMLQKVFAKSTWDNAEASLISAMEKQFAPLEQIASKLSKQTRWRYDGIDTSPAPGLDASIADAIETLTGQPFGSAMTLRACSLITNALKGTQLKTCGYSGLMLPVIEDKTLAQRAVENRFTLQELLLYSSVSGTGLDVIPLPGDTDTATVSRILHDVAALSLKYSNKALSARLFLIPGKKAGDHVDFENPYLTGSVVMKAE